VAGEISQSLSGLLSSFRLYVPYKVESCTKRWKGSSMRHKQYKPTEEGFSYYPPINCEKKQAGCQLCGHRCPGKDLDIHNLLYLYLRRLQ
jgi:hypothetical protein